MQIEWIYVSHNKLLQIRILDRWMYINSIAIIYWIKCFTNCKICKKKKQDKTGLRSWELKSSVKNKAVKPILAKFWEQSLSNCLCSTQLGNTSFTDVYMLPPLNFPLRKTRLFWRQFSVIGNLWVKRGHWSKWFVLNQM